MNGPASTVPAALAGLLAMLQPHEQLTDVQVVDEDPGDTIAKEGILVGASGSGQHDYVVMRSGVKPRDESYAFPVEIWAFKPGESANAALLRAFELLAVVEVVVATDPTLGGAVRKASVGSFRWTAGIADGKAASVINVDIDVSARLAGSLPGGNP